MNKKFLIIVFILSLITSLYPQADTLKTYYPNNKLKSVIPLLDSLRQGLAKFYFDNGKIKEERPYVNGRVEGIVKHYYKSGVLKSIYTIINGKREGNYTLYDEKDSVLKDVNFVGGKIDIKRIPFYVDKEKETFIKKSIKKIKEEQTGVPLPPKIEEKNFKDDPAYYLNVEVMPKPIGGMASIYRKLTYPLAARDNNIQGIVKVRVFIEKNGRVSKTEIVKGLGYGCDEAAETAIKYTRFTPGLLRGQKVKVQMIISVEFKYP
ncbi:MAG TPA: TonB family protein [Ignavibacteria bacterium]|nr:TonB family protein [Ignavibacteria bacterium]